MTTPFNRVSFVTVAGGTADFVVGAAVTGYNTPEQRGVPDNTSISYTAESADKLQWETGTGVYTTGDTTLARSSVRENSLGDTSKIDFTDPPRVWIGWHAQEFDDYRHSTHILIKSRDGRVGGTEYGALLQLGAGNGAGDGYGGSIEIAAGFGSGIGDGGYYQVVAGNADAEGDGGSVEIRSGIGGSTAGDGGDIIFVFGGGPFGRNGLFFPNLPIGDPGVAGAAYVDGSGFVKISP